MINRNGGHRITFIEVSFPERKADAFSAESGLSSFLTNEEITERRTEASKFCGCPLS